MKRKPQKQMQEACLGLFLCLSGSVTVSAGRRGWRWFRVRRCSRSLQGEQGKGSGSCNHV